MPRKDYKTATEWFLSKECQDEIRRRVDKGHLDDDSCRWFVDAMREQGYGNLRIKVRDE